MKILIRNGRIIDPANQIDQSGDLQLAEGIIQPLSDTFEAEQIIDARGKIVCPGLVDMRVRVREPGEKHKGTMLTESRAAAAAGVTTIAIPPDTKPVIDSSAVVELIRQKSEKAGFVEVVPLGALTKGLEGRQLSNMGALKRAGCGAVSNGPHAVSNSQVMRRALEYAATHELTVLIHPQDPWLCDGGCAHEGVISTRLGLPGIPEAAETAGVARDLVLIRTTGVRAHFCGLSSRNALQMVEQARQEGLPVTVDVAIHHLYLTEMDIGLFNPHCHVIPPLRTERDREGLIEGLRNGSIQVLCSDHQPHDEDAKAAPFAETEPGISSIETLLPLTLRLSRDYPLSLSEALATVTHQPARILGLEVGTLGVGRRANITLFDPEAWWRVTPEQLQSAGKNSPFLNWEL
ncbi:MAG: dihydroorotase, partial [Gammaproteobacteria bacterium]|nr:dihydroorotase [Gammaproteobacteria bacterium]